MLYNFIIITFTINFFVFLHIALLISVIVLLQPNLFCSKSIKIYLILIQTFFLVKIEVKIYLKGLRALICYDRICNAKGVCGTGRAFIHNKYKFIWNHTQIPAVLIWITPAWTCGEQVSCLLCSDLTGPDWPHGVWHGWNNVATLNENTATKAQDSLHTSFNFILPKCRHKQNGLAICEEKLNGKKSITVNRSILWSAFQYTINEQPKLQPCQAIFIPPFHISPCFLLLVNFSENISEAIEYQIHAKRLLAKSANWGRLLLRPECHKSHIRSH